MDIPQFKDIIEKLSIFKRHSSLLVPVIIALVGVLLFVPSQLMNSKLKAQMSEESIMQGSRRISSLRESTPASDQWKLERERQQAFQSDANQIELLAKELSQRQLLSDQIFPKPKDESILLFKDFGQRFRSGIDEKLKDLNAGECPTEEELKRSEGGVSSGFRRSVSYNRSSFSDAGSEIRDALCRSKAEAASVYINPITLSGYEFWGQYQYAGTPEAVKDCWYYQLAYWIIEDIFDTIDAMNSGSNSVFESPVKRLQSIWFADESVMGRLVSTTTKGPSTRTTSKVARDMPTYVLTIQDGLTVPWTSRVCNSDIDVLHFNVRVVVSTKAVLQFMQQLCSAKRHIVRESGGQMQGPRYAKHNQITVLESRITSINRKDEIHKYYRYGEDAVVELELICEYIFSTKGYDDIKPASVKKSQIIQTMPGMLDSGRSYIGPDGIPVTR
ncbi:MAG: hypothetical protein GWN67_10385 [Phycisphaerae bacterium]|nr:hypothetical protein [Phycisphaerae bacterium]NIR65632.1 hypothetical protein [candidate division Zixibacteria bacterium]NIP51133.1 hypothetical protein [Phycisphaerae bacterium]NIS51499.1 hypothetical protein [Phycisphaerae bacterium]NIU09090.1 hypothetical protein [Phycisphaerae bacterium]